MKNSIVSTNRLISIIYPVTATDTSLMFGSY